MSTQQQIATQVLGLLDLTSLNDNDDNEVIAKLCQNAKTDFGSAAAICIYSRFIPYAKQQLSKIDSNIKIATVVNFPHGSPDIELATYETTLAIKRGADEIDLVFPYHELIKGNSTIGTEMMRTIKNACGKKTLKVIIESGELSTPNLIKQASEIAIQNGADFLKTSTGKVNINATLDAAEIMLKVIKQSDKNVGFKAAGGIKTVEDAKRYLELAAIIMDENWISRETFRFGASSLLNDVLANLTNTKLDSSPNNSY